MAAFAGLCVLVIREMLPALREVKLSAQSVKLACTGVVDACDEVEKLAVLMAADIKCACFVASACFAPALSTCIR